MLVAMIYASLPRPAIECSPHIGDITAATIKGHLKSLTLHPRRTLADRIQARQYIRDTFKLHNVTYWESVESLGNATNIFVAFGPARGRITLLSAHYDSISYGAYDNAAGVSMLLTLIPHFQSINHTLSSPVWMAFWDLEEYWAAPKMGSIQYFNTTEGKAVMNRIGSMLNIDAIGNLNRQPNSQRFPPGFAVIKPMLYFLEWMVHSPFLFVCVIIARVPWRLYVCDFRRAIAFHLQNACRR
jgi:hypothetical protein